MLSDIPLYFDPDFSCRKWKLLSYQICGETVKSFPSSQTKRFYTKFLNTLTTRWILHREFRGNQTEIFQFVNMSLSFLWNKLFLVTHRQKINPKQSDLIMQPEAHKLMFICYNSANSWIKNSCCSLHGPGLYVVSVELFRDGPQSPWGFRLNILLG